MRRLGGVAVVGWLAACGAPQLPGLDSGVVIEGIDSGASGIDAGRFDGGHDAGKPNDGGQLDAGPLDAGPIIDVGNCLRVPQYSSVSNGSFECPSSAAWVTISGSSAVIDGGHTGDRALRMTANAQGEAVIGQDNTVADSLGKVFCARLWVKGTAPQMRIEIRAAPSGKATAFSAPVATTDWVKVPPGGPMKVTSPSGESLSVLVRAQNAVSTDTLDVDSVELWPSAAGLCDEHP